MEHSHRAGKGIAGGTDSIYTWVYLCLPGWHKGAVTQVTIGWKKEDLVHGTKSMVRVSELICCHYFLLFDYERQAVFGLKGQDATCFKYCCRNSFPHVINKLMSSYFNIAINSFIYFVILIYIFGKDILCCVWGIFIYLLLQGIEGLSMYK